MARSGDTRSPPPTGSHHSSRKPRPYDDRQSRRRSRSPQHHPSRELFPSKDYSRDQLRRRSGSADRKRDRKDGEHDRKSRRDRSPRDQHRQPDRLAHHERRPRSRDKEERNSQGRRDESRDRLKRRRDDYPDSRSKFRKEDRDVSRSRASDSKSRDSPQLQTAQKTEEEVKAERQAKLEAWKKKQLAEKEKKEKDLEKSGSTRNLLMEMDKKANVSPSVASPESPTTPQDPASPAQYGGKFDPKQIAKRASAKVAARNALGDDIAVPRSKVAAARTDSTATQDHKVASKAAGNVGGFGLATKSDSTQGAGSAQAALGFDEDESTKKKLERLPTPPPEDLGTTEAQLESHGTDDDDDEMEDDDAIADLEDMATEEEAAAARAAAAEKREARLQQENAQREQQGQIDVSTTNGDVAMQDTHVEEEDVDPLDAFMNDLGDPLHDSKYQGDGPTKGKQKTPQAIFSDETEDFSTMEANEEELSTLPVRKTQKKDIGKVDHSKMNYDPFRKNFYFEPSEVTNMLEEDVKNLRFDLDGINVRGVDVPRPVTKWSHFGLDMASLNAIQNLGFEKPTPIQSQAIPAIMSGRDVIGIAKTGSGKTMAFLLPMFRHIKDQKPLNHMDGPIGVILAPTRELAIQIHRECKPWLRALDLRAVCAYGGAPIKDQIAELKRGAEIVVATAGRFIDLLAANDGRVTNLRRVTYMVLDEADRMFDMGFEPQVMKILGNIRPDRQTVLFSATFPKQMEALARKALTNPCEIVVGGRSVVAPEVEQIVEVLTPDLKFSRMFQMIIDLTDEDNDARILVFVERQETCEKVMDAIWKGHVPCGLIHGGIEQDDRDDTITNFRNGHFPVLVATSVAARGLDVQKIKLVVNYDCPNHLEDYVHRAGRTGRAGNTGKAVTFITPDQARFAGPIAKALKESGQEIPEEVQKLVEEFKSKLKAGSEKSSNWGFGGKGLDKYNEKHDAARNAVKGGFKTGDEPDEAEEKKEKKEKENKVDEIVIRATDEPRQEPEELDLGGPIEVHRTERPPANSADRMKGVSDAAAAINARLRSSGHIRGSAPIDNKGPDAGAFHSSFEIHDLPQKARWAVTNRTNVAKILDSTGTSITTKGIYYGPDKGPETPDALPKLYILVEGDTEMAVREAMTEMRRLARDAQFADAQTASRAPTGGRYSVV